MMGHKSLFVKSAAECDAIWARHRYRYLKNRHGLVRFYKRQINKRERRYNKERTKKDIQDE